MFATENLDEILELVSRRNPLIFLNFYQFDVEFGEDYSAHIEIKIRFKQNVKVSEIAFIVSIDDNGLEHALKIFLDIDGHLTIIFITITQYK